MLVLPDYQDSYCHYSVTHDQMLVTNSLPCFIKGQLIGKLRLKWWNRPIWEYGFLDVRKQRLTFHNQNFVGTPKVDTPGEFSTGKNMMELPKTRQLIPEMISPIKVPATIILVLVWSAALPNMK